MSTRGCNCIHPLLSHSFYFIDRCTIIIYFNKEILFLLYLIVSKKRFYFIFLLSKLNPPPNRWYCTSPAPPARRGSPSYSPPSRPLLLVGSPQFPTSHMTKGSIVHHACYFLFSFFSGSSRSLSPRKRLAKARSLGKIVTRLACNAARFVSSNMPTIYASEASWRARTAVL